MKRWGIVVIVFAAMFMVFLQIKPASQASHADAKPDCKAYPAQWQELGLPIIPNGQMVWSSDASPDNGVEFEMIVQQGVEEIGAYYEDELEERDYDFYLPESSSSEGYTNEFSSDDFEITVNVRPHPKEEGKSRIHVGIRERHEQSAPTSYSSVVVEID